MRRAISAGVFVSVKELHGLPYGSHRHYVQRGRDGWHVRGGDFIPARETDIYASNSAWLDPDAAFRRACRWRHAKHLLLRLDLVIDYDERDVSQVARTLELLGALGHSRFLLVNTYRGYHLWDFSFGDALVMPEDVHLRMVSSFAKQKAVLDMLRAEGVEFDYGASVGIKRVFRVPFSRHSKGVQCTARPITLDSSTDTTHGGKRGTGL